MHQDRWEKEIDKVTEKFLDSFGSLTESQFNCKPAPNVWSIAQNIDHLILLNNSYFQNFDEIKTRKHVLPAINQMEQFANSSSQTLRPYTSVKRSNKTDTWNIWQPSPETFGLEIFKEFTNHQSSFKLHIKALHAFFLHPTFIKYPGEAELAFRLEDCIDFLIEHENRHWIQAHEVKQVL